MKAYLAGWPPDLGGKKYGLIPGQMLGVGLDGVGGSVLQSSPPPGAPGKPDQRRRYTLPPY